MDGGDLKEVEEKHVLVMGRLLRKRHIVVVVVNSQEAGDV